MKFSSITRGAIVFVWLLIHLHSTGQQTTIKGSVSIFNSRTDSGKTKPVVNAQVEDMYGRAQSTTTNDNGHFELFYYNVKEENAVTFEVTKSGLEVVNKEALTAVAGQLDTIRISMAKHDEILAYRRQMYHTGQTQSERRLQMAIKKDDDSLHNLLVHSIVDSFAIASLRREIVLLQHQKNESGKAAAEFVDKYGSVDFDYASKTFLDAFRLFANGQLDSALHLLRDANPKGSVVESSRAIDSLNLEESIVHKKKIEKKWERDNAILELRLKADLHSYRLQFDSALDCYKTLIIYDSNNDKNYFQTGFFYNYFYKTDSAIKYYQLTLAHSNKLSLKISTLNNLSDLFERKEEDDSAFSALHRAAFLTEGTALRSSLDSEIYAMTLANIGNYYGKINKYDSAKFFYQHALLIYSHIDNPDVSLRGRISVETNLGLLYGNLADFTTAIGHLTEAFHTEELLVKQKNGGYHPELASIALSLSNIYTKAGEYKKARDILDKLINQYNELSQEGKSANVSQFARIEYDLGDVAYSTGHLIDAKRFLLRSLNIRKELYEKYPDNFYYDYITALSALGQTYQNLHLTDSAKTIMKEALNDIELHWKNRPDVPASERAYALNKLALFLWSENDFGSASHFAEESVREYGNIAGQNNQLYVYERTESINTLGLIYYFDDQYPDAIIKFKNALSLLPFIPLQRYDRFDKLGELIYYNIGSCYDDMGLLDSAKIYLDLARIVCLKLIARSSTYQEELAKVNTSLGNLDLDGGNWFTSRARYLESYNYYKNIVTKDSLDYEPLLSDRENDLGNCYLHIRLDSAAYFYLLAFDIRRKFYKISLKKYGPDFGMISNNLGGLYLMKTNFPDISEAAKYFSQGHEAYTKLDSIFPHEYDSALVVSAVGLSIAQATLQDFKAAKITFNEIVQICSQADNKHARFYSENLQKAKNMLIKIDENIKAGY